MLSRLRLLIVFLFTVAVAEPAAAELLDRVVAVVNDQVINLSDLRRYIALEAPNTPEEGAIHDLIERRLLLAEAKRFEVEPPSEAEVNAALEHRGGNGDAGEFRRAIQDRLWIDRFIDQRIRFFILVPPGEVERYYQAHAADFGNRPLDEVREEIQRLLTKQRFQERYDAYIARLRARAKIRINPFPNAPEPDQSFESAVDLSGRPPEPFVSPPGSEPGRRNAEPPPAPPFEPDRPPF